MSDINGNASASDARSALIQTGDGMGIYDAKAAENAWQPDVWDDHFQTKVKSQERRCMDLDPSRE